jgi:uncharacterized protein (TIGR02147 family)
MLPSPYAYLNYRLYLTDWFAAKKEANSRFSHRLFARLAGQKSPSLLHHVIEGRRNLTTQSTESFIKGLSLRAGEAQFFRLLVDFEQAKDPEARESAWLAISTTRRFMDARRIDKSAYDYLSNWAVPAIRELATRSDFRPDPTWIADQLRPRISTAEAKKSLKILLDLGLLVESEGTLAPAEASVATAPEVASLAVRNYHQGMLSRASESIERFPGDQRHLLAVTVGVPESLLPTLKEEANAFLQRMMHLCDASADDVDRVMQMNFQLFPLSAPKEDHE